MLFRCICRLLAIVTFVIILASCSSNRKNAGGYRYEEIADNYEQRVSDRQKAIVKEAHRWIGTKYKYGGASRKGVDCSGLVFEVYRNVSGLKLPRSSSKQQAFCSIIKKQELQLGDLVFFSTGRKGIVSHVGIYIGKGNMIHASSSRGVIISNINEDYYRKRYHSAGSVERKHLKKERKVTRSVDEMLDDAIEQRLDSILSN